MNLTGIVKPIDVNKITTDLFYVITINLVTDTSYCMINF